MSSFNPAIVDPGITKSLTVPNAWGRLATAYDAGQTTVIKEGDSIANGFLMTVSANDIQLAFSDDTPISAGHIMLVGDYQVLFGKNAIKRAWIKNNVSAIVGILAVTPLF